MSAAHKLLLAGASAPDIVTYVDDLFAPFRYSGNSGAQTFNNGVDLAGKGGLIWTKSLTQATNHVLVNTVSGLANFLNTNNNQAQGAGLLNGVTAVSATGYSIGSDASFNTAGQNYVGWTFAQGDRFFDIQTKAHTNGAVGTVDLSALGTVGMVAVKRTDSSGDWMVWHRSQTAGKLTYLNLTDAETVDASISVSGTTLSLAASLPTGNYLVYAWAHDAAADGAIHCGSVTVASSEDFVSLGWEPQFLILKRISGIGNWETMDERRTFTADDVKLLYADSSGVESVASDGYRKNANGFSIKGGQMGAKYVYLAIRRPNKPPTSGAQVYSASLVAANNFLNNDFAFDTVLIEDRPNTSAGFYPTYKQHEFADRLRGMGTNNGAGSNVAGAKRLVPMESAGEESGANYGMVAGLNNGYATVANTWNRVVHAFKRHPGFFDVVCDKGTGVAHAVQHNLAAAPELVLRKCRSAATQWEAWHSALSNTEKLVLNSTAVKATDTNSWNSTSPGAGSFTVGTGANVNTNGATYVTYLFATLEGISKVGSYTGNGGTLPVDCGFAAGARFILIKRTDAAGDWYLWDSARGIVAGNDPHLSINATAAEVTTDDSVDPTPSGFIVNQVVATNINVLGGNYVFLAVA